MMQRFKKNEKPNLKTLTNLENEFKHLLNEIEQMKSEL
jgi:hypothetical protein